MLKTVNFQMFQLDLEKAEELEVKLPTFVGSWKKQESSRKTSTFALLTTPKPLTVWITTKWVKFLETGIPDHLTCLLINLYAGQETTVRTGHGTTDWFQIGKEVRQDCILSPCLFLICGVHHAKCRAGWSTSWNQDCWEISNLRYADDTTLMAESEEELKSLLMKVKEESEKVA